MELTIPFFEKKNSDGFIDRKLLLNKINNKNFIQMINEINTYDKWHTYNIKEYIKVQHKIKKIMTRIGKNVSIKAFLDNTSLKEKSEIMYFIHNGKLQPYSLMFLIEQYEKGKGSFLVESLFNDFLGMDLRGIFTILFGRKMIDIFAVEDKLHQDILLYTSEVGAQGYASKAGLVLRRLFNVKEKYSMNWNFNK